MAREGRSMPVHGLLVRILWTASASAVVRGHARVRWSVVRASWVNVWEKCRLALIPDRPVYGEHAITAYTRRVGVLPAQRGDHPCAHLRAAKATKPWTSALSDTMLRRVPLGHHPLERPRARAGHQ